MENTQNLMRSKFIQGNNKIEKYFYEPKNSFELNLEKEAIKVFNEIKEFACILLLTF